jgi:peptidylprolyl isomerase
VTQQPKSKAGRRLAEELAARKAAEAKRRRRNSLVGVLAGLAVVGVIIAAFVLVGGGDDDEGGEDTAGSQPTASAAPTVSGFPPLPADADPALATKPKVAKGSGELTELKVTTLIEGKGPATKAGQTITVNYVGVSYTTGEEFDASWNRSEPFTFQVGVNPPQVIPGWNEGLVGVKVGSRVQLDIPSNLAYGDNPAGGQPAGPLRFVTDVLAAQ